MIVSEVNETLPSFGSGKLPDKYFLHEMNKIWKKNKYSYLGSQSKNNDIPKGMSAEFFSVKLLRKANKYAKSSYDREHVTPYIK